MTRGRRLALAGTALLALLALVALASHAHRPGGGGGGGSADGARLLVEYVASVMFVLFPVGALIVLWVMSLGRRQKLLERGPTGTKVVALLAAALLVLPVTLLARHFVKYDGGNAPQTPQVPSSAKGKPFKGRARPQPAQFQWIPALVAGSLLLAAAGGLTIAVVVKRRRGADWQREADVKHALDEVLADTLDDLRAERDARKAVISAYARMERLFAAHRVPRDEAETPQEYVGRVLARLQVSGYAVRRLTALYERARFSPHSVEAEMKDDAIAALEGLRSELHADEALAA
jgi:hypothetical protein